MNALDVTAEGALPGRVEATPPPDRTIKPSGQKQLRKKGISRRGRSVKVKASGSANVSDARYDAMAKQMEELKELVLNMAQANSRPASAEEPVPLVPTSVVVTPAVSTPAVTGAANSLPSTSSAGELEETTSSNASDRPLVSPALAAPQTVCALAGEFVSPPLDVPSNVAFAAACSKLSLKVSERMQKKIASGAFVEFYELITPESKLAQNLVCGQSSQGPALVLEAKKYRQLTQLEWGRAFKAFVYYHLDSHPEDGKALMLYENHILEMMAESYDWQWYDRSFRELRASQSEKIPWDAFHQFFFSKASRYRKPFQPFPAGPQSGRRFQGDVRRNIPFGYCLSYHTRGKVCRMHDCKWSHLCPVCNSKHTLFNHWDRGSGRPVSKSPNSN